MSRYSGVGPLNFAETTSCKATSDVSINIVLNSSTYTLKEYGDSIQP